MPRRLAFAVLVVLAAASLGGASLGAGVLLGGDSTVEPAHDSNTAGRAEAFRTTASTSGTAQTISVYVDATSAATKLVAGLYSNASNKPGTLLGQGTLATVAKGAWNDVTISDAAVVSGTTYWIAVLSPSGTGTLQFRDTCCSGASETSSSQTLTTLPSSWTTGTRYTDGPLSATISGVVGATPTLQVSPTSISFSAVSGGLDPAPAQVGVSNSGAGSFTFTASSDSSWLSVTPTSGTPPATLSVAASAAGLSPGHYTGTVTVTAAGATGSPATISVSFTVVASQPPSPTDWLQVDHDISRSGETSGETVLKASNAASLGLAWSRAVDGKVTAQPLFAKGVTVAGATHDVVVAATSANSVYAIDATNGTVLWRRNFGSVPANCGIPGGFGVSAAPAIDKTNGRVFSVSDDGKLYSLSLADGTDVAAPLQVIPDSSTNKVWGGLNLVGSDLYVATASDGCDTAPWRGRILHVGVAGASPQLLGRWDVVPTIASPNGGGGIWGYGGVSADPATGNVFAATAADSNEQYTLWGDRMVELSPGLSVLGSFGPNEPSQFPCSGAPCDLDFGATPVVFKPSGCPTLAAAGNKNGNLYLLDAATLAGGNSATPLQTLQLNSANDWLGSGGVGGVPAYWAAGRMLFVVTAGAGVNGIAGGVIGLTVGSDCTLSVAWSRALGGNTQPNSTPTVANGVVYVGAGSDGAVHAYDATNGNELWSSGSLGTTYAAPSIGDGRLYVGSWNGTADTSTGTIRAFSPAPPDTTPPTVTMTAPAAGSTVSGTVSVSANASDNVGVAGVQFKLDGVNLGAEDTTAPYSVSWDTTQATAGSHTLTAVARDAAGNTASATSVTVTVDNSSPPPPTKVLLGDQTVEATTDSNTGGRAEAFKFTATASGTLSKLSVYVGSGATSTAVVAGVYADASGKPGTLLSQGTLTTSTRGAFVDVPVPAASITSGSTYWIAILSPAGAGTLQFRDRSGGVSETSASQTLTSLPATWATGVRYTDGPVSAYGSGS